VPSRRTITLAIIGYGVCAAFVTFVGVNAVLSGWDHRPGGLVVVVAGLAVGTLFAWYWFKGPGRDGRVRRPVGGVLGVAVVAMGAVAYSHWFVLTAIEAALVGLAGAPLLVSLLQIGYGLRNRRAIGD
jgi:hypothetical protein